ncbi:MAG: methyltransferase [Desulfobacterales bacterium]
MTASDMLNPGRLLTISGSYWMTCTLHAAVKLDVFTAIGKEEKTLSQLAESMGADPRGLSMLLNALCAMDLLEKKEDRFVNTEESGLFLVKTSPRYVGYMIMHHHHLVESWSRLDEAVVSGKPVRPRIHFTDEERLESFLMGMFNNAMELAPHIVEVLDLSDKKHLLDLGGGPGTYAVHFSKQNPGLRATVYDLPATRPFAENIISRFNRRHRVDFQSGNYHSDPIEGRYDVVWLSHILHGESPADCQGIIQKAVDVLEPGGMVLIHDFILNDSRDAPLFPALFSLNMLLGTQGGQSYSENEIAAMLEKAGIGNIKRIPYRSPAESGIMMGIKPRRDA